MGGGFSVVPAALRSAEAELAELESRATAIEVILAQALAGIAAAAGEPELESAVRAIEATCTGLLNELTRIYSHIGSTLVSTAASYDATDDAAKSQMTRAGGRL